jgi:hypothetical protein
MNPALLMQAADPGIWGGNAAQVIGIWVAVGFTLLLYTFLYKDNRLFKFAEHVYVGVTNGYLLWQAWLQCVKPQLAWPIGRLIGHAAGRDGVVLQPGDSWWLLVPAALSAFMLLRFYPKTAWLSRWAFAFIVGTTAGTLIPLRAKADIFAPMYKMLESPVARADGAISILGTASAFLILAGVVTVLTYFVFSVEHKGPVRVASRIGVGFLMVAFGAHFGYTVMGRESLLIGRIDFLIESGRRHGVGDAPDPYYATPVLLLLVLAAVAALEWKSAGKPPEPDPARNETPPAA